MNFKNPESLTFTNHRGMPKTLSVPMFIRCQMVSRLCGFDQPPIHLMKWVAGTFSQQQGDLVNPTDYYRPFQIYDGEIIIEPWARSMLKTLASHVGRSYRTSAFPIEAWFDGLASSLADAHEDIAYEAAQAEFYNNPDYTNGRFYDANLPNPRGKEIDQYYSAVRAAIARGLVNGEASPSELAESRKREKFRKAQGSGY